jgi:hypothetical protein
MSVLKKNNKKILILIGVLVLIAIIGIVIVLINKKDNNLIENIISPEPEKPKISIVDVNSNSRPYAVMINNYPTARPYQSGLQDAYIIYEIIVEGGMYQDI